MLPGFLEILRRRLLEAGVSLRYARRATEELADHYEQLRAEHLRTGCPPAEASRRAQEQLVADPDELLDALVERGLHRDGLEDAGGRDGILGSVVAFFVNHPVVTYVVLPVPLAVVIGFACKFLGIGLYTLVCRGFSVDFMDPAFVRIVDRTFYSVAYGLTPVLAAAFCFFSDRSGRGLLFALAACAALAASGGMLKLDLVQCKAGQHVAYFQRYGPDATRLCLPMLVFIGHACYRATCRAWTFAEHPAPRAN